MTPPAAGSDAAGPHLFLALDGNFPARVTSRHWLGGVLEVLIGRGKDHYTSREGADGGERLVLRFPDPWMSTSHARIRRAGSSWMLADASSKNGSFVNGVQRSDVVLADGDVVQCGHTFFVFRDAAPAAPDQPADYVADISTPPALSTLLVPLGRTFARLVADTATAALLIAGEHGTGKEHLAGALHRTRRRPGPLIRANGREVAADALFLSGRDAAPGELFESARGGTLLIDDVCALSMHAQYALVRALAHDAEDPARPPEDRVLVIAATHRDLAHLVKRRLFRPDLSRMLLDNAVVLPPLRQRREDIGLLIATGLRNATADARAMTFSSESARALLAYAWPHNVDELAGCLHTAAERTTTSVVELLHLPPELQRASFDGDSTGDTLDTIDLSDRARRQRELAAMLHAAGRVMILDKTRDD